MIPTFFVQLFNGTHNATISTTTNSYESRVFCMCRRFAAPALLSDIVFEIVQAHANGIHFREHNAGHEIDDKVCHLLFFGLFFKTLVR
jgi:hypothetical protein